MVNKSKIEPSIACMSIKSSNWVIIHDIDAHHCICIYMPKKRYNTSAQRNPK